MVVFVNNKEKIQIPDVYSFLMTTKQKRTIPDKMYSDIGKNIAHFRKELDISQGELASKIGITQQLIAAFEAGTRRIPLQTFIAISEILHVSFEDLLPSAKQEKKPGPTPKIVHGFELLKNLPKKKQSVVLDLINSLADQDE